MTESNYTTGTVNKASMDRYGLEGERLILFGVKERKTEIFVCGEKYEDTETFIQFNYVADKKLWLCCWYVSDGRAYISILNEDEAKSKVKEILKEWNWEGHHKLWKMIHGETVTYDRWNIEDDGTEFYYCEECGNKKEDCERLCEDCDEDRQNGVDLECDKRECDKCAKKVGYNNDCFKFEDNGVFHCYDCANWETGEKPVLHGGVYVDADWFKKNCEVQTFGTIVNASFDVCMEKNAEKVESVNVENKIVKKRIVKPKKSSV